MLIANSIIHHSSTMCMRSAYVSTAKNNSTSRWALIVSVKMSDCPCSLPSVKRVKYSSVENLSKFNGKFFNEQVLRYPVVSRNQAGFFFYCWSVILIFGPVLIIIKKIGVWLRRLVLRLSSLMIHYD